MGPFKKKKRSVEKENNIFRLGGGSHSPKKGKRKGDSKGTFLKSREKEEKKKGEFLSYLWKSGKEEDMSLYPPRLEKRKKKRSRIKREREGGRREQSRKKSSFQYELKKRKEGKIF